MNNYSEHYASINKIDLKSDESVKVWFARTRIAYKYELERFLEDENSNKSILDLGCGIGGVLNFLKRKGFENLLGVDSSEEQLEVCRKYVTDKIIKADLLEFLESNSKRYDVIIMFDIAEHIPKDRIIELFQLVYNSLSISGKLIIRTPNMGSFVASYFRHLDFTHEVGFSLESLRQVLSGIGFVKINFFNSAIGRKRIYLLKLVHRLISSIYRVRYSKVVTANILVTAEKKVI